MRIFLCNKINIIIILTLGLLLSSCTKKKGSQFTLDDIAKHDSKDDCWISINGVIYDATKYINYHPAPPNHLPKFCGKDVTQAFKTKGDTGRTHSKSALKLLSKFEVGTLIK